MSDTTTNTGHPPISLLANSYDFQALETASIAAGKVKEADRGAAFDAVVRDQALNQDVLAGQDAPAIPEESEFVEVEREDGTKAKMIVGAPEKEAIEQRAAIDAAAEGEEAPPSRRKRGTTED